MSIYKLANTDNWFGRTSDKQLYLHEKVAFTNLNEPFPATTNTTIALLGYSSDEGVRRNLGRVGSSMGPDAIRRQLGKMPNHLDDGTQLLDFGNLECNNQNLEELEKECTNAVSHLIKHRTTPILIGGSHDLAYAHYNGLLQHIKPKEKIGIINFDAHFDLRSNTNGNNSGTPFYQIAIDHNKKGQSMKYMALGIRKDANTKNLFEFAELHKVNYLYQQYYNMNYLEHVQLRIIQFLEDVDYVYTTIDLDGFSSAYAPGVSAPSPMGFSPDIVIESLKLIIESGKLVGLDVVELNPKYDIDDQTARLAASLIHYVIHKI
ncbi:formimidoylglutamase [Maribacter sp. SA7]|uniref:formimidoylglutamase n=1 Tax=Maribacter zhoushanensis TaxID=3030012 RepID=UPI0023EB0757|nr:formimidoylglutamase [Maribacter zhoushanensis]MDF4201908.1 formimidoylglutamase [Maribacter zhoushanensis]